MSAVDDIAAYLAYLKTGGNRIDQIIFDELGNDGAGRIDDGVMEKSITARHVAELERENEKLREEFDKMDKWHSAELIAAMKENAKLRELVRYIMHQCNDGNPRCDECIGWNDGECVALQRMREAGIEVDA